MREETKLRTAAGLSCIWDGEPIRRVRAGDGVVLLPGRRLAGHLMVQRDVAAVLLNDRVLMDQGLLSRFLATANMRDLARVDEAGRQPWRRGSTLPAF